MISGMTGQEVTMRRAETLSQDHRPTFRMGSVKVPFVRLDTAASKIPKLTTDLLIMGPLDGFLLVAYRLVL